MKYAIIPELEKADEFFSNVTMRRFAKLVKRRGSMGFAEQALVILYDIYIANGGTTDEND